MGVRVPGEGGVRFWAAHLEPHIRKTARSKQRLDLSVRARARARPFAYTFISAMHRTLSC